MSYEKQKGYIEKDSENKYDIIDNLDDIKIVNN